MTVTVPARTRALRVLYLSPVVPYPATDGGRQRLHFLLEGLLEHHQVYVAAMSDEPSPHWPMAERLAAPPVVVGPAAVDASHAAPRELLGRVGMPATVEQVHRSALWSRLGELPLDQMDVIHVAGGALAALGLALKARAPQALLVLDKLDVEWHRRARMAMTVRRWWLKREQFRRLKDALLWRWYERSTTARYDAVLTCSKVDQRRLAPWVSPRAISAVIPNCADLDEGPLPPPQSSSKNLVFVGMMSYRPNVEAMTFFCRDVWPRIRSAHPDAQFWIVGKGEPPEVRALAEPGSGVHVTGMVDSVRPYLERAAASVVPLLSGGGTRLKILESMAAGRAVVSTTIGAEGLDVTNGLDILIADSPDELAQRCVEMLSDPGFRDAIAARGHYLAVQKYDWRQAKRRLAETYVRLLEPAQRA